MKNRLFFFTILLLIRFNAASQVTVKISSGADGANLSYASIINLTQHTTFSANESGEIVLKANPGDSLKITHIGYLPGFYVYSNNITKMIALDPDHSILPPVIISNCRKYKNIVLKNQPKKKFSKNDFDPSVQHFAGYGWSFGQENNEVGFLLKTIYREARLKKFSFWLKKFAAPDNAVLAPMQVSIYGVRDSDGFPSKPLFRESIVFFPKKDGKQIINFDTMQIVIPENGVYISFQYIMDQKFVWRGNSDSVKHSRYADSTLLYGVSLAGIISPGYPVSYYMARYDKWSKRPAEESICFEAILSYCREWQKK